MKAGEATRVRAEMRPESLTDTCECHMLCKVHSPQRAAAGQSLGTMLEPSKYPRDAPTSGGLAPADSATGAQVTPPIGGALFPRQTFLSEAPTMEVTVGTRSGTQRRSYGTGSLFEKVDSAGRVAWYGKWRHNGVQVKRKIGPKRREGSRDGLTRRAAEGEMRRLMSEIKPNVPASEALTIGEGGRLYIAHLERVGRKLSTRTAVESVLRVHLEPFFCERSMDSVTHEDVIDLMTLMEGKGIGPKSIRNYIGTLSALYRFSMHPRRRWATFNPCDGVELPAVPDHAGIRYLELDQVEALVSGAQSGSYEAIDRAMYRTAAMTGLRLGELLALRWRDVDWPASTIRVRSNYVLGEFGTPKSRRSSRGVPMADDVAGELDRFYTASGKPADDGLVFPDPSTGLPLDKAGVLRRMRRALKAAKLDETHRFHDLRHTFGTAMAAAGVPMRTLQEWMGHRDIGTTQRYADYAPRTRDAELVAAAFARPDTILPDAGAGISAPSESAEVPLEVPT
jgi:integrase